MNPTHIFHAFQQAKTQAIAHYFAHREPRHFFRDHVAAMDVALQNLWQTHFHDAPHLALLATGGLGRKELYPHSDLDLAIASPQALSEREKEKIAEFIQKLWDNQLSPAVKSGSLQELCDCAKTDLTADTAFLEARHLSGCLKTAKLFYEMTQNQRDTVAFIEGKLLEMQQRHAKQPALMLEPNIKNGVGGLRDIHTMMWLAKVQNLHADFVHLRQNHVINHIEAGMLRSSYRVLARLRIELHCTTGREEDRLLFDLQQKLTENGKYGEQRQQAMEQLMREFYRASKNILQLNQIIIPMLQGRIYAHFPRITHPIDDDYYHINHQIAIKNPQLFEQQPEHIFKIIKLLQQDNQIHAIAPQTLRAWWTAVQKLNHHFYLNEQHRAQFLSFFQMGTGLTATMRLLNVYGVLGKYLPAWDKIVGLLQHDLFHVYPVDDHILMVLRNLRRLDNAAYAHELPFASALMQGFEKKNILYLAALLHDIAKGRNGDHAILGAQDAKQFAHEHRLPENDAALLAWLVEQHLLFSIVAQKQDIHDPEVVRKFCQIVDSHEKLTALYLLTVADIRGTNPQIWNAWKAQLLATLFQAASRYLSGEQQNRASISCQRKQQAHDLLIQKYDSKRIRQLWQALGEAYFVYFDDSELAWQLPELIENIEQACVRTRWVDAHLHVLVYMPNQARLFTRICRLMSQQGWDILAAKAWVTAHNFILDELIVQAPEYADARERQALAQNLHRQLTQFTQEQHDIAPQHTAPSRRARLQPIAPHVLLTPDTERTDWYTLEVVGINRPALLADITEVFARHKVRLYHARIATLADRVEDNFLLHCPNFDNTNREWAFQQDLLAVLA